MAERVAEEVRHRTFGPEGMQEPVEVARAGRDRALHPLGQPGRLADDGAVAEEPLGRAGRKRRPARQDEVLGVGIVAGELGTRHAIDLDRHPAMGGDAVAQRLSRTLCEADRDRVSARGREQPLGEFGG